MLFFKKKKKYLRENTSEITVAVKNLVSEKTFVEALDEWLEFHHIEIADSTYYGYKMMCPLLREYFASCKISSVDTFAINKFILKKKREGMTNCAIYNYCRILALCFDYAFVNGYVSKNPVRDACVPKVPRHTEVYPFSFSEIMKLLEQDYLQWVKDGIMIAFHTGMRMGEIYALKWTDIDFEQKFIMVQRTQSRAGSKVVIKSTKTACGVRRIDIDRYLVSYLQDMKKRSTSDFVFDPVEDSKYPFRVPWNLSWHVKHICMMAGIPPRNFHALRHTHATILLAHGVHPKIVQERLGHSDIRITIMTYSHVLPTIQREAVKVFERICGQYSNDDRDAVAVFDNLIELSQYGYYYVDDILPIEVIS